MTDEFKEHMAELRRLQQASDEAFENRKADGGGSFVAAHNALIRHLAKPLPAARKLAEEPDLLPAAEPFPTEYGVEIFVGIGAGDLRICPHTEAREASPFIYRSALAGADKPTAAPPGAGAIVLHVCGQCAATMRRFSLEKEADRLSGFDEQEAFA